MIDQCSEYSKGDLTLALCENPVPRLKLSLMLTPGYGIFDGLFPAQFGQTLSHLTLCLVDTRRGTETRMPDIRGNTTAVARLGWSDILVGGRSTSRLCCLCEHTR